MLPLIKSYYLKEAMQCSTPRKSNPGNILLTSKNPQNYFYQCRYRKVESIKVSRLETGFRFDQLFLKVKFDVSLL